MADYLTDPLWWITSTAAAVLISLVSDGARHCIKRVYEKGLRSWAERSVQAAARRASRVELLSSSFNELLLANAELNQKKIDLLLAYVEVVVVMLFSFIVKDSLPLVFTLASVFSLIAVLFCLRNTFLYGQESLVLQDAKFAFREAVSQDV